jgi:A/G-specific adenine glycosylase
MSNVEVGYGLALRRGGNPNALEVLLVRRPAAATVMPGMWELPALVELSVPEAQLRMTVRHSIMQVNYIVRIQSVTGKELRRLTAGGRRQWFGISELGSLPLTGLARKVLIRAKLLTTGAEESLK